jgi:ATP/maltotriose-dependent transcriptional regulator MalT/DNA-binding SARP family transcriptional activator
MVPRKRLHALFDANPSASAIWVSAPAGAGKTTAVVDYLAGSKTPVFWYRVDAGDLDLASFFFDLGRTVARGRRKAALPIFGPEYANHPEAFARRYLREYFTRLPAKATLVFDDLHVAGATLVPGIIAIAIEELPPDFRMFLVTREQAPAEFARFRANSQLAIVDEAQLVFADDEAAALIRDRAGADIDTGALKRIQASVHGWAAGLVLLSEQTLHSTSAPASAPAAASQPFFDYFAREVFAKASVDDRRFMELTALLPEMSPPVAAAVAQRPDAQALLENFYRRQIFVSRSGDSVPRYQYHDLFRNFLLEELRRHVDALDVRAARTRAAQALLAAGERDSAIAQLLAAGQWAGAAELLVQHARTLLEQGRRATLVGWVRELPSSALAAQPWLSYWLGVSTMIGSETSALEHFERAYAVFAAGEERAAMNLTAAQAVLAIQLGWSTHVGSAPWIERLRRTTSVRNAHAPGDRLRVATAMMRAASMEGSYRPETAIAAEVAGALEVLESRSREVDANDRLIAAEAVQEYAFHTGAQDIFERAVAAITPDLGDPTVTPWAKCQWLVGFGTVSGRKYPYAKVGFPYPDAEAALNEAWTLSQREGLRNLRFGATSALLNVARARGNHAKYAALVARLESECDPSQPTQACYLSEQRAMYSAGQGDYEAALRSLAISDDAARRGRLPPSELWSVLLGRAQYLIGLGRCAEAADVMREHAPLYSGVFLHAMRIVESTAALWTARTEGGEAYANLVRGCMGEVRTMGWVNYLTGIPLVVAQIWADALEFGIEREFIVAAIRQRRMAPPPGYWPSWPWRVRVRALGPLGIECDDAPVRFGAKAQLKPLELLKVLVASPRHTIAARDVLRWLWPQADTEGARAALDVAVHRLRKLLGDEAALALAGGKLQLAPELVWVDASAFETWLDEAQRTLDAQPQLLAASRLAERLFADYRGPLFGDDDPMPWSVALRERLHGKFLQLTGSLGRFHERHEAWRQAEQVYERGLAQDSIAEEFYRGLIRCQLALGEPAAAMQTFRRCREILSVVLGVRPAPATAALVASLTGSGAH